ncbi:FAD-dependent oxidoreductase [Breznakiella homolactica]|uniref:FAD-binding protein n=1 Tax=Breznakiella homolactica TaxID=2798577 RepID=A0A7T7XPI1_9SPIR|nr:FAD-binding protein [Breznakiella homolactica]QQO09997.1 FAD-binding protein [Breznakiella homolactica]
MSKETEKKDGISRRDFVKAVGAGAAVVAGTAIVQPLSAQGKKDGAAGSQPDPTQTPKKWDLEADVVIIGSGAVGLPAAIRAVESGASVIVVDTNYDIGGHAITSGGNCPMGGGTSFQKKYGIQDDPDTYFKDLTDWSVVEVSGMPDYRYNDPLVQRALADNMAPAFEFLLANGVPFVDQEPDNSGAHATGISAKREHHTRWTQGQSAESPAGAGGTSLMRALEDSARKKGVKILLNYHMDVIFREGMNSGKVLGIQAHYTPTILPGTSTPLQSFRTEGNIDMSQETVSIKANKSIIIGTGGSTGNVDFRRMFDHRLDETYPLAADEYSPQDASGELAAMAIGASLWGTTNQTMDRNGYLRKRPIIGTRTNYIGWTADSPLFPKIKYTGLRVRTWQDAIIVNQAGKRFYNEMQDGYPNGTHEGFYNKFGGYVRGDWRNATKIDYKPQNYCDAALAINEGSVAPNFSAGPQWAIFDSETVRRERWNVDDPTAANPELFFKADTLEELADKINTCPWQKHKMSGQILKETVQRYNSFVDGGADTDFDKPKPMYKFETGPFYAAWATFAVHDTYVGLRINDKCQVQTMKGDIIPGLYCGGESAGGCSQHGLARCLCQGYIAGKEAVNA